MGAAVPKSPLAIHPRSKLWGFLAFSNDRIIGYNLARALAILGMVAVNFKIIIRASEVGFGKRRLMLTFGNRWQCFAAFSSTVFIPSFLRLLF